MKFKLVIVALSLAFAWSAVSPASAGVRSAPYPLRPRWSVDDQAASSSLRAALPAPAQPTATPEIGVPLSDPYSVFVGTEVIDDFESGIPLGTSGWEAFADEQNPATTLVCGVDSSAAQAGNSSLRVDFYVEPESWASCALRYALPQDLASARGLVFDVRAGATPLLFNVDVYTGPLDARATYRFTVEVVPQVEDGWAHYELIWDQIRGVAWEAQAGQPVDPAAVSGFAFSFDADADVPNTGTLWVDNFGLLGMAEEEQPASEGRPTDDAETGGGASSSARPSPGADTAGGALPRPCGGSIALGLLVIGLAGARSRFFELVL